MQITYGDLLLCSPSPAVGRAGPRGLAVNGAQVNESIDLARAAALAVVPRGNRSTTVSFTVARFFASARLATAFLTGHFGELEPSADLVLTLDDDGTSTDFTLADACIERPSFRQLGCAVEVTYEFRAGGTFTTAASDPDIIIAAMRTYNQAIASGAEYVDIVFTALSAAPSAIPQPSITVPDGQPLIEGAVLESTITTTGFRLAFNAAIPATGYRVRGAVFA